MNMRTEKSATRQLQAANERIQELEEVCSETYQVVGCLLDDLGDFNSDRAEKILDNLSLAKMKHKDVLPWESIDYRVQPKHISRNDIQVLLDELDTQCCLIDKHQVVRNWLHKNELLRG